MWLPAETTVAPTGSWISRDAAKIYLRADGDETEDDVIDDLIATAADHVERYTGTRLFRQMVKLRAGSFDDLATLPIGPVVEVSAVEYLSAVDGSVTAWGGWEAFGAGLAQGIRPAFGASWPSIRPVDDAIRVTLSVGYAADGEDLAAIPPALRRACYLLLGDYYMNREDTIAERSVVPATMPNGVDTLLANLRIYG
jgi:uncharacterized phiE125 gp8 family phage protein